jgi:DNA-binding transcriptional MerR regulator
MDDTRMRIGELAELTGVTPRAIRYYHRIGLLPEPPRTEAGYRSYGLSASSRLAAIRRLSALGLTLSEVGDVLAGHGDADLGEVLGDLDADLAARQEGIARRRSTIARLRERELDPTLSPALAEAVQDLTAVLGEPVSQEQIDILRAFEAFQPDQVGAAAAAYQSLAAQPELARLQAAADARFAELAGASAEDPRVEVAARQIYAMIPDLLEGTPDPPMADPPAGYLRLADLVAAELSPAQQRVITLLMDMAQQNGSPGGS